jgi:hypothetical protein
VSRLVEVLELFAEAQRLAVVRVDWEELRSVDEGGVEGWRQAYRERHRQSGLCISCREPAMPGRQTCVRHGRVSTTERKAQMRAWEAANRERRREQKRASYHRTKGRAA